MSHFAKRHYEAIAQVLQNDLMATKKGSTIIADMPEIIERFADMLQSDNPQFDRRRFIHACQPGSNVKARTAHLKVV